MFHVHTKGDLSNRTIFHWFLLAFLAGCVNAGGFLACGKFVSHVTGFATLFGVEVGQGRLDTAFGIITVPAYFLMGVMLSAYLIDRRVHEGRPPLYTSAMLIISLCLLLSALGGKLGWFSAFDGSSRLHHDYVLLALLCMASGLQNASITTATGATVRTTHLTGITTDLGLSLVRQLTRTLSQEQRRREALENRLRVGKILSFALGSAASSFAFFEYQYLGFLVPACIAIYMATVAEWERRQIHPAQ